MKGGPNPAKGRKKGSKNKLSQALKVAGHATGKGDASGIIDAIDREHAVPNHATDWGQDRPILRGAGPRKAVTYTWRGFQDVEVLA